MILIDANLLVYAHVASVPQHQAAAFWLDRKLNGTAIVALPWQSLLSFARIVTNPRIFERPLPVAAAWAQIENWLNCPIVQIPNPGDRYRGILARLMLSSVDRANLILMLSLPHWRSKMASSSARRTWISPLGVQTLFAAAFCPLRSGEEGKAGTLRLHALEGTR